MKHLFQPYVEERSWVVNAPLKQVRDDAEAWMRQRRAKILRSTHDGVIGTFGSRFLTRMVGGAWSRNDWVPVGVLIALEKDGKSTKVFVRVVDNLGMTFRRGGWTGLVRRRFAEVLASLESLGAAKAE